jgi:hypothetical protein
MIEFTYKNSSYFGYEGGKLNRKTKPNTLSWMFAPCSREPLPFKDECIRTAELLAAQAKALGREPVVMLSGGQDSEVVCKAFIDGGIPFRVSSFKHDDDELLFETEYIDRFVKRHGLKHTYLSRDWYTWMLTDEAHRMYVESDSVFTSYVFPIALYEQIWNDGGYPIGGTGDAHLDNIGGTWYFVNQESLLTTWYKYGAKHEIHGAPIFFQHTPEVLLSMLLEPEYQFIGSGSNRLANVVLKSVQEEKYRMYYRLWPDVEKRKKYYQYMMRLDMFRSLEQTRNSLRPFRFDEKWNMPYNDFVNLLKGER